MNNEIIPSRSVPQLYPFSKIEYIPQVVKILLTILFLHPSLVQGPFKELLYYCACLYNMTFHPNSPFI